MEKEYPQDIQKVKDVLKENKSEQLIDILEKSGYKSSLVTQISSIDFSLMNKLSQIIHSQNKLDNQAYEKIDAIYNFKEFNKEEQTLIEEIGYTKINEGKVALLILCGGRGSRLGIDYSKALFSVGLHSNKAILEYLLNRLFRLRILASEVRGKAPSDFSIVLYTSEENFEEIKNFIEEKNYFNFPESSFIYYKSSRIPAYISCSDASDLEFAFRSEDELLLLPNGNGDCLFGLKNNGILEELKSKKVEFIHFIPIDNPLAKPLDPRFVGLTYLKKASMSAKTIEKHDPNESIGVFIHNKGVVEMIDYNFLSDNQREERDSNGKLSFRTGNILSYLISVEHLQSILTVEENNLEIIDEYKAIRKKERVFNFEKKTNECREVFKFEIFLNSIFKFVSMNEFLLFEVERDEEFAPIKNPNPEKDSQYTARTQMYNLFRTWIRNSGVSLSESEEIREAKEGKSQSFKNEDIEIDFLQSYNGENLSAKNFILEKKINY